ncbi:hypothetical protein CL617_05700 [archaeon]|nr:hypothetical protein [archaeon]|tara:strand:+ start:715 stop:1137 length:423 start_codon:yes stop_codon:yes gene_type:complete
MLRLNANAIIENEEKKILFIKLKKGPYINRLSIPGGGLEFGEWSNQAAAREVYEETGIKIDVESLHPIGFCELRKVSTQDHRVVLLLHGKATGEPVDSEEATAFWLDPMEIENKLIPFAKEALKIYKNKGLHFKIDQDDN